MAAVGPEVSREAEPVRKAVTDCLEDVLDTLAGHIPGANEATRRRQAILLFTTLVGAMVSARAVADLALSDSILRTVDDALAKSRMRPLDS